MTNPGKSVDGGVGHATPTTADGASLPAPDEHSQPLTILLVATEAVPFAKEGGVADVMGSLPREVAALGHKVALFLPRYGGIDAERWGVQRTGVVLTVPIGGRDYIVRILRATLPDSPPDSPVAVYFLDNQEFFGRSPKLNLGQDQRDEQRRFGRHTSICCVHALAIPTILPSSRRRVSSTPFTTSSIKAAGIRQSWMRWAWTGHACSSRRGWSSGATSTG
jgi:hypothetical protein